MTMRVALGDTKEVRGKELMPGMTTVVEVGRYWEIDERLESLAIGDRCRGRHFRTRARTSVCYDSEALVRVLR
jgi:hypothetical protein